MFDGVQRFPCHVLLAEHFFQVKIFFNGNRGLILTQFYFLFITTAVAHYNTNVYMVTLTV